MSEIRVGQKLANARFARLGSNGVEHIEINDYFAGRKY